MKKYRYQIAELNQLKNKICNRKNSLNMRLQDINMQNSKLGWVTSASGNLEKTLNGHRYTNMTAAINLAVNILNQIEEED